MEYIQLLNPNGTPYIIDYGSIDNYYKLFIDELPEDIYIGNNGTSIKKKNLNKLLIKSNNNNNFKELNILKFNRYINFEFNKCLNDKTINQNNKIQYILDDFIFNDNLIYTNKNKNELTNNYIIKYHTYKIKNNKFILSKKIYEIYYYCKLKINEDKIITEYYMYKTENNDFLKILNLYYSLKKLQKKNNIKLLTKEEKISLVNNIETKTRRIPESNKQEKNKLIKNIKSHFFNNRNSILRINNKNNKIKLFST